MQNNILLSLRNIICHLTEKKISILLDYKIILSIIILLNLFSIFPINSISNTSALEYSNDTNLEFTFNPTLSLSVSGNLVIDNLTPGTTNDSNVIDVNVSTNNVSGYSLSATVGSSNNATTNLTNTSNSNYTFTSLTSDTTNLTDFNPNTWGYSYSVDNGTTWSNYSGLPLYTSTPTSLFNIYNPSENTINFKIGAKASNTQPLGEYTNTINFTATTYPSPLTLEESYAYYGKQKITVTDPDTGITGNYYTMQDMTSDICGVADTESVMTAVDIRDNSTYTIAKINDSCWMTQNLRITGIISSEYSNFVGEDIDISWRDLDADFCNDECYSYAMPMTHKSDNVSYGVWYNYCAAGACNQLACQGNYAYTIEYDICPSNWSIPNSAKFNDILDDSTFSHFNPVAGGHYDGYGRRAVPGYGSWWSTSVGGRTYQQLALSSINIDMVSYARSEGHYIRCIAK